VKKVKLDYDEWYPVFSLKEDYNPKWHAKEVVEIEDKFYSEYLKALEQFSNMQNKLQKLAEEKGIYS